MEKYNTLKFRNIGNCWIFAFLVVWPRGLFPSLMPIKYVLNGERQMKSFANTCVWDKAIEPFILIYGWGEIFIPCSVLYRSCSTQTYLCINGKKRVADCLGICIGLTQRKIIDKIGLLFVYSYRTRHNKMRKRRLYIPCIWKLLTISLKIIHAISWRFASFFYIP